MTRRSWIADEFSDDRAALTGAHAAHLSRTLRARIGQRFEVTCGDQVRQATVSSVQEERVEFTLGEEVVARETVPIALLLAVFKFDRMELAIEKCTELNVSTIIPVIARRSEKHLALAAAKRVERWRRIAREASEQSRRVSPPEIRDPLKLKEALELEDRLEGSGRAALQRRVSARPSEESQALAWRHSSEPMLEGLKPQNLKTPANAGLKARSTREAELSSVSAAPAKTSDISGALRIVLAESRYEATLSEILRANNGMSSLSLAIGPEGGWTTEELQSFATSHWVAASLGDTILRAETAAISAVAVARAELTWTATNDQLG